jgi:glycosyltransferase involved in cell wall biosynthesis
VAENGVDPARIRIVPYGVDLEALTPPPHPPSGRFRVLFVGQMVHRKGLSYLLEAWRSLALPDAELVLAGRGNFDRELLARHQGSFRLAEDVSPGVLRELYRSSDVLCVPSLAEGFGLVYLEALACGTPVIGTVNTAAADMVTEGENGWVVEIRSADAIAERLRWCHAHRDALAAMRPAARRTAEGYTWERFRRGVADAAREAAERAD